MGGIPSDDDVQLKELVSAGGGDGSVMSGLPAMHDVSLREASLANRQNVYAGIVTKPAK